ncbi:alcohol dehydrogenase catalytic domain-containing protein [Streptomyces sp. NPDC001833]|uniref:alcohol dehydrogenase catalytic domain-containing protein n=1 Tax=Streptomyces sp. NPDC001833 TaxID=3154658 RepID=UPI003324BB59
MGAHHACSGPGPHRHPRHPPTGRPSVPDPGPGQFRVRVEACGLNPLDYQVAVGGHLEWAWLHVLGLDVAGRVDAVGDGVTGILPGQRVAFHGDLRRPGGLAEYALADAPTVAVVPDELSAVTAAAMPCAGMTAYQAVVRRLHVKAGDTVLVTAGWSASCAAMPCCRP